MRKLLSYVLVLIFSNIQGQTISPQTLITLWNQRSNEQTILNYLEKNGFSYYDAQNNGSITTIIYQANPKKSSVPRAILIEKEDDLIVKIEYNTFSKNDYTNYISFLESNGFKYGKSDVFEKGNFARPYIKGNIMIGVFQKKLKTSVVKYNMIIGLLY